MSTQDEFYMFVKILKFCYDFGPSFPINFLLHNHPGIGFCLETNLFEIFIEKLQLFVEIFLISFTTFL